MAETTPSVRSGSGRRVDLLGRDVRHVPHAGARVRRAALLREARAGEEPDGEVGAGAGEVERVEVERVEPARHLPDLVDPLRPGSGRVRLVQPADVDDVPPEPLERVGGLQIGIDRLRPGARREGRQRPRDGALVDHLEELRDGRQPVEPGAGRVDAVQQPRRDDRHEHGAGRIEVAEIEHPPSQPGRHPLERAVGRAPPPGSASRRDRSRGRRRSGLRARTRHARSPPPAAAPRAAPRRRAPDRAGRSRRPRRSGRRSASGRRRPRGDRIA